MNFEHNGLLKKTAGPFLFYFFNFLLEGIWIHALSPPKMAGFCSTKYSNILQNPFWTHCTLCMHFNVCIRFCVFMPIHGHTLLLYLYSLPSSIAWLEICVGVMKFLWMVFILLLSAAGFFWIWILQLLKLPFPQNFVQTTWMQLNFYLIWGNLSFAHRLIQALMYSSDYCWKSPFLL